MIPTRVSPVLLSSFAVGVTVVVTWVAWKYMKKRCHRSRPVYVAKKICVVNSLEQWEEAYVQLKQDLSIIKVLGLDCEWVESHKVALLQLASPSGRCILVRLVKIQPYFPESLRLLLADNSILKVGVAIIDDGKRLYRDYGLTLHGCVDLRHVLKRVRGTYHCPSKGLRGLANGILGVDISKNNSVRCGNWETEIYSQQQVEYAATDAAVAVDIFLLLVFTKLKTPACSNHGPGKKKHSELSNVPSSPSIIQENPGPVNETAMEAEGTGTLQHLPLPTIAVLDTGNKNSSVATKGSQENSDSPAIGSFSEKSANNGMISEESVGEHLHLVNFLCENSEHFPTQIFEMLQDDEKERIWKTARSLCQGIVEAAYVQNSQGGNLRTLSKQGEKTKNNAYSCRKRPLWDNCRLQAPDSNLLCTCDLRKAQWYLDKELGDIVCEDPFTVRLRFEPSKRPDSERNYYLQEKKNVCVVCGCDKDYVRKFIVPFEYRKFFPSALKDHSSHDVLLLCTACHRKSSDSDVFMRLQLAEECSAPLDSGPTSRTFLDHELQKVRSAGRALLTNKTCMPNERIIELEKVLQDFYGVDVVTEELVKQAADTSAKQMTENYVPHGKKVVTHMASNGGLLTFQRRWRQHFLDTMNPQYLPTYWSVEFIPEAWSKNTKYG